MVSGNTFGKISLVIGMLFASTSLVNAMDGKDTHSQRTHTRKDRSHEKAQHGARKHVAHRHGHNMSAKPHVQKEEDITPEEWAIIKQQTLEAEHASRTIWTRDPGRKVPEDHPQYRLRAENMPDSQKSGDGQAMTQGLGAFIQNLERDPNRDQLWAQRAQKNEHQMKLREVVPSAPPSIN
jgi:hypothetical protein